MSTAALGRGTRIARLVLGGIGVAGLAFGGWVLMMATSVQSLVGLLVWLAGAVVLHDAVLSPALFVADRLMRRAGRRLPGAVLAVVQVAVLIGAVLTLIVLPEIRAKSLGVRNPSVLPFDYGLRLGLVWAALAVLAVAVSLVVLRLQRRRQAAPDPRTP